ncbi:MAG: hypothetical protein DHS20C08_09090 [Rhodomicrobium sp.]|nr:MAG: hypothetical protein DHS20C08_09090 [Rhodomicrobium sp.]
MQLPRRIADFIADIWRDTRRLLLVLWLCRVSTASATLALILAFLPQVQDLYTELTYYSRPSFDEHLNTFIFWLGFYSLAFLWAFTIHYCARTVLAFETWPLKQSDEAEYSYWIEAVPRYLGWISILSIFLGQINALKNLQIEDQTIASASASNYTVPLIVIFALIIFIQTVTRRLGRTALLVSVIAILYWLVTAWEVYFNAPLTENLRLQLLHNLALPVITILFGCLFYLFVAERRRLLNWLSCALPWPHRLMLKFTAILAGRFPVQIRPMHNAETRELAPKFLPFKKHGLFHFEAPSENVRGLMLGLSSLTLIMLLWLTFAISDPSTPPFGLRRALLLPVLLGIWVPLLTTVTFLSNQIRFPLLTSFIILGLSMSWFLGDNHDIELAAPLISTERDNPTPATKSKIALKTAVELWMKQHNCETTPRACPPPIIIAASGGASRSAFFTTTVLGELLDKPALFWPNKIDAKNTPVIAKEVTKRIFAISSVSGGSLGSAIFAATLKGHRSSLFTNGPGGTPPCRPAALRSDKLLFSVPEDSRLKSTYPVNWKNCLQAMAAGDFLSPAMVSFAFRDNLAISSFIGLLTGTDRAKSLEHAWSERVARLTGSNHLEDPLLTFKPTTTQWMPLLLLNGTSVTTGKRLIATPLASRYDRTDKIAFAPYKAENLANRKQRPETPIQETPIFADSLDLHNLLQTETESANGWSSKSGTQAPALDITLAKAVSLSARFPLISPHGNLRDREGNIIDRVVDGGYFDNSGMLTALEISNAIEDITNNALKPILVQISNHPVSLHKEQIPKPPVAPLKDPTKLSDDELLTASVNSKPRSRHRFRCPEQSFDNHNNVITQRQLLPELRAVTSALLNARVARGSHAIARAALQLGDRFVHFQVAAIKDELGANKKLSMSWWLSKSVQNALNNQIKWRRLPKEHLDEGSPQQTSIRQNLNPAFCAIQKFRKAQLTHWREFNASPYQTPVFAPR